MAGPIGPSLAGSLLWQATQFAKNTALPLCTSRLIPGFALSSSPQATTKNTLKPKKKISFFTYRVPRYLVNMQSRWRLRRLRRPTELPNSGYKLLA
jgi:hypothetical protein